MPGPQVQTLTVGAPGRGLLRVTLLSLLAKDRMADEFRPLRLGTIMMFGSLDFKSLGFGYDMVLLPPRDNAEPRPEPIPP